MYPGQVTPPHGRWACSSLTCKIKRLDPKAVSPPFLSGFDRTSPSSFLAAGLWGDFTLSATPTCPFLKRGSGRPATGTSPSEPGPKSASLFAQQPCTRGACQHPPHLAKTSIYGSPQRGPISGGQVVLKGGKAGPVEGTGQETSALAAWEVGDVPQEHLPRQIHSDRRQMGVAQGRGDGRIVGSDSYRVSFGDDESILKLIVMTVAHLWEYTKTIKLYTLSRSIVYGM